jgi:hypothetical protein
VLFGHRASHPVPIVASAGGIARCAAASQEPCGPRARGGSRFPTRTLACALDKIGGDNWTADTDGSGVTVHMFDRDLQEEIQKGAKCQLVINPVLHHVFARMELAEERGLGLKSMKARAEAAGLPLPRFQNHPRRKLLCHRHARILETVLSARRQWAIIQCLAGNQGSTPQGQVADAGSHHPRG